MQLAQLLDLSAQLPPFALERSFSADALAAEYLSFYGLETLAAEAQATHHLGYLRSGEHRLAVHAWRQEASRGNLLLVHGYLDHTGLFTHLIRYGLSRGFNVVCFDLPGHGLSSGEPAVIDDFGDYSDAIASVQQACAELPGDWSVMAQSTGGAAFFNYLLKHGPLAFRCAVLLAPLIRPMGWGWIRPARPLLSVVTQSVRRGFAENSNDAEFLKFVREDPLQSKKLSLRWLAALSRWLQTLPNTGVAPLPILVIQGDADQTVDWRYNCRRIEALFAGTRIEYLPGGRHHLANESEDYRMRIAALTDSLLLEESPASS